MCIVSRQFTIGLYQLANDGSYELDANGEPLVTYDTGDIMEFAKCWTGFDLRKTRGNIEHEGHGGGNRVDPMQIKGNGADTKRDLFPKMDLHDGYLGDATPLCADLPRQHFLSKGARWSYLGHSASARQQPEALHPATQKAMTALGAGWAALVPRVAPDPTASSLYAALCGASSAGDETPPFPPFICR